MLSPRCRVPRWLVGAVLAWAVLPSVARADDGHAYQFAPFASHSTTRGAQFESANVKVTYAEGQTVQLAGDPTGTASSCPPEDEYCGNVWVDDAMDMTIVHADGTQEKWSNEWTFECYGLYPSAPVDLSGLFAPGVNQVHMTMRDECGGNAGHSALFFIGDAGFGPPDPPPAPDPDPAPSSPSAPGEVVAGTGGSVSTPAPSAAPAPAGIPLRDAVARVYFAPHAKGEVTRAFRGPTLPSRPGIVLVRFFIPGKQAAGGLLEGDNHDFSTSPFAPHRAALAWNTATGDVTVRITKSCRRGTEGIIDARRAFTRLLGGVTQKSWLQKLAKLLSAPDCNAALPLKDVGKDYVFDHADERRSTNLVHVDSSIADRLVGKLPVRLGILNSYTNAMPAPLGAWSVDEDLVIEPSATTTSGFAMTLVGNGYPAVEAAFYPDSGSPQVATIARRMIQAPHPSAISGISGYVGGYTGSVVGTAADGLAGTRFVGKPVGGYVGEKLGKVVGGLVPAAADGGGGDAALNRLSWAFCTTDTPGRSMGCAGLLKGDHAAWTTRWTP